MRQWAQWVTKQFSLYLSLYILDEHRTLFIQQLLQHDSLITLSRTTTIPFQVRRARPTTTTARPVHLFLLSYYCQMMIYVESQET